MTALKVPSFDFAHMISTYKTYDFKILESWLFSTQSDCVLVEIVVEYPQDSDFKLLAGDGQSAVLRDCTQNGNWLLKIELADECPDTMKLDGCSWKSARLVVRLIDCPHVIDRIGDGEGWAVEC